MFTSKRFFAFLVKSEKHLSTVLGNRICRIRMFWASPIRDGSIQIRDPGWKNPDPRSRIEKSRSGMEKIQIRDKHPGSATLHVRILTFIDQEYLIMYSVMINVAYN